MLSHRFLQQLLLSLGLLLGFTHPSYAVPGATVDGKVLVLARDTYSASTATSGLQAYGIPYESVLVPKEGTTLPTLNSSATAGNYGGIIVMAAVSYDYDGTWRSALTDQQWDTIYAYQKAFKVRSVRTDEFPGPEFGNLYNSPLLLTQLTVLLGTKALNNGCCEDGTDQLISFSNTTSFPTANLKTSVSQDTQSAQE